MASSAECSLIGAACGVRSGDTGPVMLICLARLAVRFDWGDGAAAARPVRSIGGRVSDGSAASALPRPSLLVPGFARPPRESGTRRDLTSTSAEVRDLAEPLQPVCVKAARDYCGFDFDIAARDGGGAKSRPSPRWAVTSASASFSRFSPLRTLIAAPEVDAAVMVRLKAIASSSRAW
jgi:hypothetical protein